MSYHARVFSREGATGHTPNTQLFSVRQFVHAYVDVRSPNNFRRRWNFASPCTEPTDFPIFLAADLVRSIGGGVWWQILGRMCRVR